MSNISCKFDSGERKELKLVDEFTSSIIIHINYNSVILLLKLSKAWLIGKLGNLVNGLMSSKRASFTERYKLFLE